MIRDKRRGFCAKQPWLTGMSSVDSTASLAWAASDSHVQSDRSAHSCSMDTNSDAPPAAAPRLSAQSTEEHEAWLPPAAAGTEVADSPTATMVDRTQAGAGRGLSVVQSARGGISVGCC